MYLCEIIERRKFKCEKGRHPNDSLLIVLKGNFVCNLGNSDYYAHRNDVFVFHSDAVFERKVIEPLECIYIQFDKLPMPLDNGIMKLSDPIRAESTISFLKSAILEDDQIKIMHYVNDLLLLNQLSTMSQKPHTNETISKCITFLHENYTDTITLDTLTQHFHFSKQWLIRCFKQETEKTPIEYLNRLRIRQAQKLLTQTEQSIGEISSKCGFDNVYYFSNAFKKRVGLSPKDYRKKLQL